MVLAFGAQIDETVYRACRYFMAVGKYNPNIAYKEIWAGDHHKLEFGIPWGDAGQGLKI